MRGLHVRVQPRRPGLGADCQAASTFGVWCEESFLLAWRPPLPFGYERCSHFRKQLSLTDTQMFNFNLNGAKPHLETTLDQVHTEKADLVFLHTTYSGPKFASDARSRLWEGATVTYVALQLAFYMGFQQVILIGVDHSFSTKGKPNTTITSQGDDQDHFDSRYFGEGYRWQLPDLATSERAYRMARDAYQHDGREVLDATVAGKLTVFPKVDYQSLFQLG